MIPLDELRAVRVVISHGYPDGPCPDGLAAAMVVQDVLPKAEVRFVVHNTREHEELRAEPHMLFVDMVPPEKRAAEFVVAGAIVLDHHKSSEHVVRLFRERGVFGDEAADPGVSGAVLAFEHVWRPLALSDEYARWTTKTGETAVRRRIGVDRVQAFAALAGVRDTWQTNDPRWRDACMQAKVLRFFPSEDWLDGDPLDENRLEARMTMLGEILMKKDAEETKRLLASAYRFSTPAGTRVVVLPSTYVSDAANALKTEADVVIGFNFRMGSGEVPDLRLSFRSRGSFDVAAIAKTLGGGGHTNAAGAAIPTALEAADEHYEGPRPSRNPYTEIRRLMERF